MQHKAAPARAARAPVLQVSLLAALVLLALGWSWQRPALVAPAPPSAYITDLVLPLDVGTLEQQVGNARGAGDGPPVRRRWRQEPADSPLCPRHSLCAAAAGQAAQCVAGVAWHTGGAAPAAAMPVIWLGVSVGRTARAGTKRALAAALLHCRPRPTRGARPRRSCHGRPRSRSCGSCAWP